MNETNLTNTPQTAVVPAPEISRSEIQRYQTFVWIQIFFLGVSVFAGGFNYKVWSMLDSAILIVSIGIAGLLFVVDEPKLRRIIFYVTIVLYLLAIVDMAINVLISGAVGWRMF